MSILDEVYGSSSGGSTTVDYYDRTSKEVENLKKRLGAAGVSSEVSSPGPLMSLLRLITRPGAGSLNAVREFTNPYGVGIESTPGVFDPGAAFVRGLTGKQLTWGKDIAGDLGASDKPWFTTNVFGVKVAPNPRGLLGTGIDLLNPADPLNWIAPGVGKVGTQAIPKGAVLLEKTFGKEVADDMVNKFGREWVEGIGKLDKYGNPSITSTGQLMNLLVKKATDKGIQHGINPETVSETLVEEMMKRGLKADTRVVPKNKYNLKLNVSAPFSNKNLGSLNLPFSTPIATGAARIGEKITDTALGQAIGKSFSTGFVPKNVPASVWTRLLRQGGGGSTMDTRGIIPNPMELDIKSGPEAYKDVVTQIQKGSNKATVREQDFETALNQALKGLSVDDRKELMKAMVNPEYVLPPRLKPAFEFLDAARNKMVEDYRALGVDFVPLENYVPFVVVGKPLTRDENELIKAAFGPRIRRTNQADLTEVMSKADPHLLSRTLNAVDPAEVNKVLGREFLTEDIGVAMARRGVKAIRGQEATKILRDIMTEYGLTIDDIASIRSLPDGYVLVKPRVESSGRVSLQAVKETNEKGLTFALPQEFVNAYHSYTDLMFNPSSSSGLIKFVDQFTRAYKTVAYLWTPGHIPRDFTSNLYNLWLGGMRDYTKFYDAAKLMLKVKNLENKGIISDEWSSILKPNELTLEGTKNLRSLGDDLDIPELKNQQYYNMPNGGVPIGDSLTFPKWQGTDIELYKTLKEMGLTESSGVLTEFQQAGKDWSYTMGGGPVGKYTDVMRKATRSNDNLARIAGVLDGLQRGMTLEQAVGNVKKVLFDYSDLTPFEKNFMKRVVPFYTWMRKNIPLQVEMMLTQPGKYATTYKAMHDIGLPEDGTVPEFITQAGGLEVEGSDGKKKEILPSLPFSDIAKLPTNTSNFRELLGSINPLYRVPFEIATNTALFSGQPLENYGGELTKMPLGAQLEQLGLIEEGKAPLIPKRTLGYILNQVPPLRNLDVMTNPENARQAAKISSFMGGAQTYPEDWAREAATYENRDKLRDLVRVLEDKGISVPTIEELKKEGGNSNPLGDIFGKKLNKKDKALLKAMGLI